LIVSKIAGSFWASSMTARGYLEIHSAGAQRSYSARSTGESRLTTS